MSDRGQKSAASESSHEQVSLSKSALLLSPCTYWALPEAKWYDDRYTDKSDRNKGTEFHKRIDRWLKQNVVAKLPAVVKKSD